MIISQQSTFLGGSAIYVSGYVTNNTNKTFFAIKGATDFRSEDDQSEFSLYWQTYFTATFPHQDNRIYSNFLPTNRLPRILRSRIISYHTTYDSQIIVDVPIFYALCDPTPNSWWCGYIENPYKKTINEIKVAAFTNDFDLGAPMGNALDINTLKPHERYSFRYQRYVSFPSYLINYEVKKFAAQGVLDP